METCNKCGTMMYIGVQIRNTNVAFVEITSGKMYENDDRPLLICTNEDCEQNGIVVINPWLLRNIKKPLTRPLPVQP